MGALKSSEKVAVVGAGTMGAGIAQLAAAAGHETMLFDTNREVVERAVDQIGNGLGKMVARGRLTDEERSATLARIHPVRELSGLAEASLVVEAIIEDLATKRSLFGQLEQICSPQAILATNTSSLSITAIAAPLRRPERLVGMHFFNPAPVMKLVEVIRGVTTSPGTVDRVYLTAKAWGKRPVLARSTPGFIVNRVARPFYAEALRALEEGAADCPTLDAIMRECGGFRMGPFELMDLIGHDVNYAVTHSIFSAFYNDPRFLPSLVQKELVDGGLLGRKSGRGFYDHGENAKKPQPSSEPTRRKPAQVVVSGPLGPAESLVPLMEKAGIRVLQESAGQGLIVLDDAVLCLTDGRSATRIAADTNTPDTLVFDLALDYEKAERIAVARADSASASALNAVVGLFQALGKSVSVIDDIPGLLVLRTVCMLANEAADAVLHQVCDPAGADTAMCNGLNYPKGPLAWADEIGPRRVLDLLENLQQAYGLDRYRPSRLLRRTVENDSRFIPAASPQ